jgi:hypothetical protein
LSDHNALKTEINNKNRSKKHTHTIGSWTTLCSMSNGSLMKWKWKLKGFWKLMKMKMTYQNLWHIAKAVPRGKFIAMSAYIKRTKRSQINDLMLYLKLLEK